MSGIFDNIQKITSDRILSSECCQSKEKTVPRKLFNFCLPVRERGNSLMGHVVSPNVFG